ncbi:MAG: folylpolyglutamate synthase/dihydrofolate synthase family protein [Acidobacteriota bacterium]
MNFDESVNYLLSLGNEVTAMKLGLENIRRLLTALDDPQKNYLKVQVAGTNGKGSVCAFLDAICRSAGIRTGLYTSPHLVSMTERIKIDGEDISEADFARLATHVRQTCENLVQTGELAAVPTYFEQVTAIGLRVFEEAGVQLAILETGLGGRLDATTAANGDVLAITRIDLDHQQYLGESLEEIAAEKAAIIRKPSDNVVIGEQPEPALRVILARCRELGVEPVSERYKKWTINTDSSGTVEVATTRSLFPRVRLGLLGKHQIENAATAINIIQSLKYDCGLDVDDRFIVEGLEKARHPGRLEYQGRYLFDGAHNIGGANALADYLNEFEKRPIIMVFGAMSDKNVGEIARILFPLANKIILTKPANSRAIGADQLAAFSPKSVPANEIIKTDTVSEALRIAEILSSDNKIILVTGSLYLVGEAKRILDTQP